MNSCSSRQSTAAPPPWTLGPRSSDSGCEVERLRREWTDAYTRTLGTAQVQRPPEERGTRGATTHPLQRKPHVSTPQSAGTSPALWHRTEISD
ncbi:hypothetical protein O3P69_013326 [Scylla paramamosain]|uniref:Uncharacterized protein n=1 Tax=Scylla paramamosain TaxID=85552 RepID=A0AAW0TZQ0_SCYPA